MIVNLLHDFGNESSNLATKNVIYDWDSTNYGQRNENGASIKFKVKFIQSSLSDYSDAYIFAKGGITATNGNANTNVAFTNCAPFTKCVIHINDEHVDTARNLDFTIPM